MNLAQQLLVLMMEFVIYLLEIVSKESKDFSNVDISVLLKILVLIIKHMFFKKILKTYNIFYIENSKVLKTKF
jgi:hypothetical protein